MVVRGEGERRRNSTPATFASAMAWLMAQAESQVGRQRCWGLGEMNPSSCGKRRWTRRCVVLLRVQIEDAIEADRVFTMLMGDEVEPRRDFIESNALRAANIDASESRFSRRAPKLIAESRHSSATGGR